MYYGIAQSDYDREKRNHYMHYAEVTSEGEAINNHFHVFD